MGSLQDLKTYVTAAATGMLSTGGFVWLVTDPLGRLGVIVTHGAGTLLVNERRQALSPNSSTELGGIYIPTETTHTAPAEPEHGIPPTAATHPQSSSSTSGLMPPPLCAHTRPCLDTTNLPMPTPAHLPMHTLSHARMHTNIPPSFHAHTLPRLDVTNTHALPRRGQHTARHTTRHIARHTTRHMAQHTARAT